MCHHNQSSHHELFSSCRWTLSSSRLWPMTRCLRRAASLTALGRYVQCTALCLTFTFRRSKRASTGLGGSRHTCASATKVGLTGTTAASSPTLRCGASRAAPPSLSCRMWRLKILLPPFWRAVSRGGASSSYCGCARVKSLREQNFLRTALYFI